MKTSKTLFATVLLTAILASCVPARKYEEIKSQMDKVNAEAEAVRAKDIELSAENAELAQALKERQASHEAMVRDTAILSTSLRHMRSQYDKINELNEQLLDKYDKVLKAGKENELRTELEVLKLSLQNQEDSLSRLAGDMAVKQAELADFDAKLKELQAAMQAKEQAMNDLKARIAQALKAYEGKGLSVEHKHGKIYVGLEAKLLFASGSTEVDKNGREALKTLAKAIENERDLQIIVEGHTDTDKIVGSKAKYTDNWDLSVLRATAVVRILMANANIEPTILSAAGRGEHLPVDLNDKSKNRRIEVILAPDLEALYDLVD